MFSVRNYIPGVVENDFVFVKTGEMEDDLLSGIYRNGTIIMNTNSAVLEGIFRLNPKMIPEYPSCNGTPAEQNALVTTFQINLGSNFNPN